MYVRVEHIQILQRVQHVFLVFQDTTLWMVQQDAYHVLLEVIVLVDGKHAFHVLKVHSVIVRVVVFVSHVQ